ncbi:MAG: hypothetical protein WCP38_00710 [Chloroflexota bacterium]
MGDLLRCMTCGNEIPDGAPIWEVKVFLDPRPPRGVACSTRCADKKRSESKLRAIFWYNSPANPFNRRGKDD